MHANLTVFFYDYEDMQFQATDSESCDGAVTNIPEAKVQGFELAVLVLSSDNWSLALKLSHLDTDITST